MSVVQLQRAQVAGARAAHPWPAVLLGAFAALWLALAIAPWFREDWALENVLAAIGLWWLVRRHRRQPLSLATCGLLFAFGVLHEIGAHYTYAEVPYDAWAQLLTGTTLSDALGLTRNHYDRVVHFAWGLLLYRPTAELLRVDARWPAPGRWLYPAAVLVSLSMVFELFEWWAAALFGGDLGQAYLGTQGDIWDAQKDMGLALLGAALASAWSWRASTR